MVLSDLIDVLEHPELQRDGLVELEGEKESTDDGQFYLGFSHYQLQVNFQLTPGMNDYHLAGSLYDVSAVDKLDDLLQSLDCGSDFYRSIEAVLDNLRNPNLNGPPTLQDLKTVLPNYLLGEQSLPMVMSVAKFLEDNGIIVGTWTGSKKGTNETPNIFVPKWNGIDEATFREVAEVLLCANPGMAELFHFPITKYTEETASLGVGKINGRCFKLYQDREIAEREVKVLLNLGSYPVTSGRVQKLAPMCHTQLADRLEVLGLSTSEIAEVVESTNNGYLQFRDLSIVVSECEDYIGDKVPDASEFPEEVRGLLMQADGDSHFTDEILEVVQQEPMSLKMKRMIANAIRGGYLEGFDPIGFAPQIQKQRDLALLGTDAARLEMFADMDNHFMLHDLMKIIHVELDSPEFYSQYVGRTLQEPELIQIQVAVMEKLKKNRILPRMQTLALIHGEYSTNHAEMVEQIPAEYSDFLLMDSLAVTSLEHQGTDERTEGVAALGFLNARVHALLSEEVLRSYLRANERQRKIYEERKQADTNPLRLVHGDAKYDNWFGDGTRIVLGDFGSVKRSTEYKDIAKALLDSIDHFWRGSVEMELSAYRRGEFLEQVLSMVRTNPEEAIASGWVRSEEVPIAQDFIAGRIDLEEYIVRVKPVIEEHDRRRNDRSGFQFCVAYPCFRSNYDSTPEILDNPNVYENLGVIQVPIPGEPEKFASIIMGTQQPPNFSEAFDELMSTQSVTPVIDGYLGCYVMMRDISGFPIQESFSEFRANVYDAMLTEAIRTIHYKSPMPQKKNIVDHMVKVAEHYAKKIVEVRTEELK